MDRISRLIGQALRPLLRQASAVFFRLFNGNRALNSM